MTHKYENRNITQRLSKRSLAKPPKVSHDRNFQLLHNRIYFFFRKNGKRKKRKLYQIENNESSFSKKQNG